MAETLVERIHALARKCAEQDATLKALIAEASESLGKPYTAYAASSQNLDLTQFQDGAIIVIGDTIYQKQNGVLTNITSSNAAPTLSGRNIGEVFYSLVPLVDATVHLLNGGIIYENGVYSKFVEYMAGLYNDGNHSTLFCTETQFQQSISDYGVCGKFVYDSVAGTLRLPKVTGFMQGTVVESAIGDLVEAGLPNIEGDMSWVYRGATSTSGAFSFGINSGSPGSGTGASWTHLLFDASASNSIYGNSSTVQPQAIKGYVYIVLANAEKTQIEVNIDEIATDLNGKADVDLTNCTKPHIVETWHSGKEWYRKWSDGWVEQGVYITSGDSGNVNLPVAMADTNYIIATCITSVYTGGGATNALGINSKTTTGFVINTSASYIPKSFYVCGYMAS